MMVEDANLKKLEEKAKEWGVDFLTLKTEYEKHRKVGIKDFDIILAILAMKYGPKPKTYYVFLARDPNEPLLKVAVKTLEPYSFGRVVEYQESKWLVIGFYSVLGTTPVSTPPQPTEMIAFPEARQILLSWIQPTFDVDVLREASTDDVWIGIMKSTPRTPMIRKLKTGATVMNFFVNSLRVGVIVKADIVNKAIYDFPSDPNLDLIEAIVFGHGSVRRTQDGREFPNIDAYMVVRI